MLERIWHIIAICFYFQRCEHWASSSGMRNNVGFEGLMGSEGSIVTDNFQNGQCHQLRTCILIDISLVVSNFHIPKCRDVFAFMISRLIKRSRTSRNHNSCLWSHHTMQIKMRRRIRFSFFLYIVACLQVQNCVQSLNFVSRIVARKRVLWNYRD